MKAVVYTTIDTKFIDEWASLWHASPYATYANAPYWFLSVLEIFKYKKYTIIALYKERELIAVAALVNEKKYGINFYTVVPGDFICGLPFLVDYQDEAVVDLLIHKLLELGTIFLDNVSESAVSALRRRTSSIETVKQAVNFYLPLSYDEHGSVIVPHKNKLQRGIRGIEGKFTLRSFTGETEDGLRIAFTIDAQSRKHTRGYNTFSGEGMKLFYQALAKHFQKNLLINILYFENTPIAYEMGFLIGKTYFGNQIAFVGKYGQYSPGKIILVKLLEYLGTKHITKMDFGSGDSLIKRMLTNEYQQLYQIILSKNKFERMYIKTMSGCKTILYNNLHQRTKMYSLYRILSH